jgi:hypothetical protein
VKRPELDLTEEGGQEALRSHCVERALLARSRYGPSIGPDEMRALVADRSLVRFEARIVFDGGPLRPGELGWAMPQGERPHDGFALVLPPELESRPEDWPLCAAYHLVSINYLDVATSAEAEAFGAALFGMEVDDYYARLCGIADSLPGAPGANGHLLPGDVPASQGGCSHEKSPDPVNDFLERIIG